VPTADDPYAHAHALAQAIAKQQGGAR
jgi:hypothetical protein